MDHNTVVYIHQCAALVGKDGPTSSPEAVVHMLKACHAEFARRSKIRAQGPSALFLPDELYRAFKALHCQLPAQYRTRDPYVLGMFAVEFTVTDDNRDAYSKGAAFGQHRRFHSTDDRQQVTKNMGSSNGRKRGADDISGAGARGTAKGKCRKRAHTAKKANRMPVPPPVPPPTYHRPKKNARLVARIDEHGNVHPHLVGLDPTEGRNRGFVHADGTPVSLEDVKNHKVVFFCDDMGYAKSRDPKAKVGVSAMNDTRTDGLYTIGTKNTSILYVPVCAFTHVDGTPIHPMGVDIKYTTGAYYGNQKANGAFIVVPPGGNQ
jgi:hypothetical protein